MGSLGVGLALIVVFVLIFVSLKSSRFSEGQGSHAKDHDEKGSHKFHILRNTSFCCGSGRYSCCKPGDIKQSNVESSDRKINIPTGLFFNCTRSSYFRLLCRTKNYILSNHYVFTIFMHQINNLIRIQVRRGRKPE